jgi:ribokinase
MQAVVIGNIAIDETFRIPHLPQPGETLLAHASSTDLGGKGANQAVVLARTGVPTRLLARIGRDAAASRLRALLAGEPLDASALIETDAPADRSIVLLSDSGENAIVSAIVRAPPFSTSELQAALRGCVAGDLLVLQGNLTEAVTAEALRLGRARGLRTVFNPSPVAPGFAVLWPLVDLAVLNAIEAHQLTRADDPTAAARAIRAAGARQVAVTLGADGALLCDADGITRAGALPVTVRDTTGAGDAFAAVLAVALLVQRLPGSAALAAASHAAALTVSRAGTLAAFPTAGELAAILRDAA